MNALPPVPAVWGEGWRDEWLARIAEHEPRAIDRAEPPYRRSEPEDAVLGAHEIGRSLQRAGKPQDGALVEAGGGGDVSERHLETIGMECIEHGQRALHCLDPVRAHATAPG